MSEWAVTVAQVISKDGMGETGGWTVLLVQNITETQAWSATACRHVMGTGKGTTF